MTPSSLVELYVSSEEHTASSLQDNPEDGGCMFFRNVCEVLPQSRISHSKIQAFFVAVRISNQAFVILTVILMNSYMPFLYQ
jgi:hypothetical protein